MKRGLTANRDGSSFEDPSYRLRREASELEAPVEEDLKGAETHHLAIILIIIMVIITQHIVILIHIMDTLRTVMVTDGTGARE